MNDSEGKAMRQFALGVLGGLVVAAIVLWLSGCSLMNDPYAHCEVSRATCNGFAVGEYGLSVDACAAVHCEDEQYRELLACVEEATKVFQQASATCREEYAACLEGR